MNDDKINELANRLAERQWHVYGVMRSDQNSRESIAATRKETVELFARVLREAFSQQSEELQVANLAGVALSQAAIELAREAAPPRLVGPRKHHVNPETGRCVFCARNKFQRGVTPDCDYKPDPPRPSDQDESDLLWHYSIAPFTAACGADKPNQGTTQSPQNVTCETCRKLIGAKF